MTTANDRIARLKANMSLINRGGAIEELLLIVEEQQKRLYNLENPCCNRKDLVTVPADGPVPEPPIVTISETANYVAGKGERLVVRMTEYEASLIGKAMDFAYRALVSECHDEKIRETYRNLKKFFEHYMD